MMALVVVDAVRGEHEFVMSASCGTGKSCFVSQLCRSFALAFTFCRFWTYVARRCFQGRNFVDEGYGLVRCGKGK